MQRKHFASHLLLILILAAALVVAAPDPAPASPVAHLRAGYWRAMSEAQRAETALEQAKARLLKIVTEMQTACDGRALQLAADGEPDCAAPEPAKEATK